jgi:hypothetical protein
MVRGRVEDDLINPEYMYEYDDDSDENELDRV